MKVTLGASIYTFPLKDNMSTNGELKGHPASSHLDFIRRSLDTCNAEHKTSCVPLSISNREPNARPSYLIDVTRGCIVDVAELIITKSGERSLDRYVALSYVWTKSEHRSNTVDQLRLCKESLSLFLTPGFFESPEEKKQIPAVILNAIELTKKLKEQYLWVDRFCIVQDDYDTKNSQISNMNHIYGEAYLTIIAASLDHIFSEQINSDYCMKEVSFGTFNIHYGKMIDLYAALTKTEWSTRGWTFQEQILSRRSIIFTNFNVFWDCHCAVWDGQFLPVENSRLIENRSLSSTWWPDFQSYLDIICLYNGRKFTFPQDGLHGISATLRVLSPAFPGGFVAGLPKAFLDQVLIWQPFNIAKRRRHHKDGKPTNEPVGLPTWSWCGWECFVDPTSLVSGLVYLEDHAKRSGTWRTKNLVEWSFAHPDNTSEKMIIQEPRKMEAIATRTTSDIPNGWKKNQSLTSPSAGCDYFTYELDDSPKFRYPILLSSVNSVAVDDPNPPYLIGRTTSASFIAAAIMVPTKPPRPVEGARFKISAFEHTIFNEGPKYDEACSVVALQQKSGSFAGVLRLMDGSQPPKHALRLIAISVGTASERDLQHSFEYGIYECNQFSFPRGKGLYKTHILSANGKQALGCSLAVAFKRGTFRSYPIIKTESTGGNICEFYNVLWVEERDGVAYRKACGWIPKHIWDKHAKTSNVTLG